MTVTLESYCKGFKNLYLIFAAIPFVAPVIHAALSERKEFATYLYPPIGNFQYLGLAFTVLFLFLSTFVVYFSRRVARRVHPMVPVSLVIIVLLAVCGQIWLWVHYVRIVQVPSIDAQALVSIGYKRTELSDRTYPNWNDTDILHDRGPSEDSIEQLWTLGSIAIVRISLWFTYFIILDGWLFVVCLGVYQNVQDGA